MSSKLKIKTSRHRSGASTDNFEHNEHLFVVFQLLNLNRYIFTWCKHQPRVQKIETKLIIEIGFCIALLWNVL